MNKILVLLTVISLHNVVAENDDIAEPAPCICGIFLSGQIPKDPKDEPTGRPALTTEAGPAFANNAIGLRQCMNKCLESIVKFLPKSGDIICGTVDRDCHKEKAFLFVQNYSRKWINSNMSAGREYCCKDNMPYKCPVV